MTATALGLVNTLRAKTRTVDPAAIKDDDYGWGTYKVTHAGLFLKVALSFLCIVSCRTMLLLRLPEAVHMHVYVYTAVNVCSKV